MTISVLWLFLMVPLVGLQTASKYLQEIPQLHIAVQPTFSLHWPFFNTTELKSLTTGIIMQNINHAVDKCVQLKIFLDFIAEHMLMKLKRFIYLKWFL